MTEAPSRWRSLAATDPEIAAAISHERHRQNSGPRADRLGELRQPGRARSRRLGADQQVRRRLSRQALLRRLRVRRRRRVAGDRAREGAVRRRARQRAAALGRAGEHGGLLHAAQARRHGARHEPGARRPPHARPSAQLLRQALHHRPVRRPQGRRADRLRGARAARARAQAEDDHGRRQRLSARLRLRAHRARSAARSARRSSPTWRTSPGSSPRRFIRARCRTPTSSRRRRTRRCAARAAAWSSAARNTRRTSIARCSPASRADR